MDVLRKKILFISCKTQILQSGIDKTTTISYDKAVNTSQPCFFHYLPEKEA